MKRIFWILLVGLLIGQPTSLVHFGGSITESDGTAITGTRTVVFNIYDAETGGSPLWASTRTVTLTNGHFDVDLGAVTPLTLPFDEDYFVEMTVAGETMTPRVPLPTTAYAQRAEHVTNAVQSVSSSVDHTGRTGHLRFVPMDGTEVTESMSAEDDTIYIAIGGEGGTSPGSGSLTPAQLFLATVSGTVAGPVWDTLCVVEPYSAGDYIIPIDIKLDFRRNTYYGTAHLRYTIYYYDGTIYNSPDLTTTYYSSWYNVIDTAVPFHSSYLIAFSKIVVEGMNDYTGGTYSCLAEMTVSGYEIEP